jgi:hypothetical protein
MIREGCWGVYRDWLDDNIMFLVRTCWRNTAINCTLHYTFPSTTDTWNRFVHTVSWMLRLCLEMLG